MKTAFFWCYPWDLLDEGIEAVIDRLAGEVGVNAISVSAATHAFVQLRPHAEAPTPRFSAEAAVHFQPEPARYSATRLRPQPAAWMKSRNPLETIARACERRGLRLRAVVTCCLNETLAERFSFAACRDVFGAHSRARLCPANPDVREYAAALVADLAANYPLAAVELYEAGFSDDREVETMQRGIALGDIERFLLSLCFCESCRQLATAENADPVAAERATEVYLRRSFDGAAVRNVSVAEFLGGDEVLSEYLAVRRTAVTRLLDAVRRATEAAVEVHVPPDALLSGLDAADAVARCDALMARPTTRRADGAVLLGRLAEAAGSASRVTVGFSCAASETGAAELVRDVHEVVARGHETIGFWNYGLVPAAALDWTRQAIRYARRET